MGEKGIISANNSSKPGSNEMFNPRSPSHAIFSHLAISLGPEGRYHLFNAMANQLRYPCSLTYYFRCTLLQLFLDAPQQYIQEQITRVLLERLIVHRPHPWGLLVTFIELIKNNKYLFWEKGFTKFGPELEKVFDSVAKLCLGNDASVVTTPKDMHKPVNKSSGNTTQNAASIVAASVAGSHQGGRRR